MSRHLSRRSGRLRNRGARPEKRTNITNPGVLVEVTSDSTEGQRARLESIDCELDVDAIRAAGREV